MHRTKSSTTQRERERVVASKAATKVSVVGLFLRTTFRHRVVSSRKREREREREKKICVVTLVLKEEEEREIGLRDSSSRE